MEKKHNSNLLCIHFPFSYWPASSTFPRPSSSQTPLFLTLQPSLHILTFLFFPAPLITFFSTNYRLILSNNTFFLGFPFPLQPLFLTPPCVGEIKKPIAGNTHPCLVLPFIAKPLKPASCFLVLSHTASYRHTQYFPFPSVSFSTRFLFLPFLLFLLLSCH